MLGTVSLKRVFPLYKVHPRHPLFDLGIYAFPFRFPLFQIDYDIHSWLRDIFHYLLPDNQIASIPSLPARKALLLVIPPIYGSIVITRLESLKEYKGLDCTHAAVGDIFATEVFPQLENIY